MKKLFNQKGIVHILPLFLIIAAVGIISFLLISSTAPFGSGLFNNINPKPASHAATNTCGLTNPAFCDTFDTVMGTGNRSGDLNGLVWGISRTNGGITSSGITDPWLPFSRNTCGTFITVSPESDNTICNGMWVEGQDDGTSFSVLAAYPKQPFDIAGRTGKVVFDINADFVNGQGHGAWPEFVYTDQPVPAPHENSPALDDFARNSIGFGLFDEGGCAPGSVTIRDLWFTQNYQFGTYNLATRNCIVKPTTYGELNHIEVDISPTSITILGTDAGVASSPSTLKVIASVSNIIVPLTRGLIWLEDTHYNGNKDGGTQQVHTFTWDNVGFDGPILPRDLAFDVSDRTPNDLGYFTPSTLNVQNITASNISAASGAIITLNFMARSQENIIYSVNGNPSLTFEWPFGNNGDTFKWHTVAMPVPLSEIIPGTNTLNINTSSGDQIANIDLILIGAGGIPTCINPSQTCNGTPSPTSTPSPSPTCLKGSLGDINCDGVINIFDYNILITNFGKSGNAAQGDLDNNGTINIFDYNILVGNFGK